MIKKQSQFDVGETLDRLEATIKAKGINPVARVDHAAAAKSVELELRPTQVLIFGNPRVGTALMQSDQRAGLELPMRVLAWEAEDGTTWLGYHAPQSIVDHLGMDNVEEVVNTMTATLDALTDQAVTS